MFLASRAIIESVDRAWYILAGISLVLMIGIMGALIGFVVKYHRSRHPRAERIHGNTKLEITWTVLPTLLSVYLFFVGYQGFALMRTPPEGAAIVEVHARQWVFSFHYPKADITTTELVVPVNRAVRCNLSSSDVIHSFYLPYFRVKEDCVPGVDTHLWFQPDVIGEYNIFCAEFCGKDHAQMITKLRVVSQADFDTWMDEQLQLRNKPVSDVAEVMDDGSAGLRAAKAPVLYKTYCASCHGQHGEGGLVEGARSFQNDPVAKWKRGVKITDMFRTLTLGLDGTRMKSFANLSAWERFALAHHVARLYKDGDARSETSRADYEKLVKEYKLDEQRKVTRDFPIEEAIDEIVSKGSTK